MFETTIRVLGGLLSAYELSGRAAVLMLLLGEDLASNIISYLAYWQMEVRFIIVALVIKQPFQRVEHPSQLEFKATSSLFGLQ